MKSPVTRRAAAGFSMIEVLIALVVLAVGLLGLALLQTMNLRYTKSAQQRTQAVNLASELLDTMRSNRSEIAGYTMAATDFAAVPDPTVSTGCPMSAALTSASNKARWQCEVKEALGNDATADVTVNANSDVNVTVTWKDIPGASDGAIQLRTQL